MSEIELRQTCGACPEQYDAYLDGRMVGYLRLRHGSFTVEVPDHRGKLVYSAQPQGDGCFESDERDFYLDNAKQAIMMELEGTQRAFDSIKAMLDNMTSDQRHEFFSSLPYCIECGEEKPCYCWNDE